MHEFINRKFSFCFHIDPKLGYLMHISDNRGLKKHKLVCWDQTITASGSVLSVRTETSLFLAEMSSGATKEEILPLNIVPGQGDKETTAESSKPSPVRKMISNLRNDRTHRVLAIMSIICGVSCIGIKALISSVKVRTNLIEPDVKIVFDF